MAIKMLTDKSIFAYNGSDGRTHYRAQLIADTAEELSGVTEQDGVVWDFGSVALTADGKSLMLDSEGVWHDLSDGSEANSL